MPKIAQAQSDQVSLDVVRAPRASGNVPAAAFGGDIAQGLGDVVQAGLAIKKRIDTTAAEEALIGFEKGKNDMFFNPDSGYFNTQGRNAYDGAATANSTLEKLKKQFGDSLNPQSREMFDRVAGAHVAKGKVDIGRHSFKGLQAWETATAEGLVENTLENSSLYWTDPQSMRVQRALGEQAVIDAAGTAGIGAEATAERLQTYRSAFASNAVNAATQSSSVDGQDQLDQFSGMLEGPDRLKLEKTIAAKQKSETTQANARASTLTATNLVEQYDSRSDIQTQVNAITDPELRKQTMAESMRLYSQKRQAESEGRGDAFEAAEAHIVQGGSATTYQVLDPDGWEKLSAKQQGAISAGKAVNTDWVKYSDLMTMPKAELARVSPSDHFPDLAPAERKSLISAVKSANGAGSKSDKIDHQTGRTRTSETSAAVEQLFGKKTGWNDDKRDQVSAFYSVVDDERLRREAEIDRPLTSEEYTSLLSGLTRKVVQEGFIYDSEVDLTDIPAEDVGPLSKFLRDNNIPVTSDNLIKAHLQATK